MREEQQRQLCVCTVVAGVKAAARGGQLVHELPRPRFWSGCAACGAQIAVLPTLPHR